jgi:MoaA/NifB/PqqE/SkfB family radical SAM enzyme
MRQISAFRPPRADQNRAYPFKRTVSFLRDSVNIFFHILTACNLSCIHCYINKEQHGYDMMPLSVIESWLSQLIDRKKNANIVFLGGEPTLHPDLFAAVKKAGEMGCKSITIDTNGYLFNDILSKTTPDDVDFFSFSMDGATRETNDSIRGKGSYDMCISGIRNAGDKGFSTSLIYTVSTYNLHELRLMPDLLKSLGISRFFIQVIGIRGKSADSQEQKQVSRFEWLNTVPKVAETAAKLGITTSYPKVFLRPDESFECAGKVADNFFVFPNGRVYRCPLCEDFPLHGLAFVNNRLEPTPKINETDLFELTIAEGCVMNRLIQPDNLLYHTDGTPEYQIACCMLKEEIPGRVFDIIN